MKRVILVNIFVAYLLFPLLINFGYIDNILFSNYLYYGTKYSFGDYLVLIFNDLPIHSTLFLCFCLIPLQLIKIFYIYKKTSTSSSLFFKGLTGLFILALIGAFILTGGFILS
ncbi:MAG: hypothetical protein K0Q87_2884, partial [Neobacillus sp.]|nr:hypothetical protein [Neobacillus sp.]